MKDRSTFGIILILLGLGFLLDQFNIISFNNIVSNYWPIILIVIGGFGFLNKKSSKAINGLLIVFGLLFQARNIGLIDVNIYKVFWPIILIVVGIRILFEKTNKDAKSHNKSASSEAYIDELAIMSGLETNIESQEFKGGKITAIMASVELDLRDSKLYNNEATLNINALMSGVEIYVPENWKIKHSGTPLLGEFSNKKRYKEDYEAPILNINFSVMMGSIEVK